MSICVFVCLNSVSFTGGPSRGIVRTIKMRIYIQCIVGIITVAKCPLHRHSRAQHLKIFTTNLRDYNNVSEIYMQLIKYEYYVFNTNPHEVEIARNLALSNTPQMIIRGSHKANLIIQ